MPQPITLFRYFRHIDAAFLHDFISLLISDYFLLRFRLHLFLLRLFYFLDFLRFSLLFIFIYPLMRHFRFRCLLLSAFDIIYFDFFRHFLAFLFADDAALFLLMQMLFMPPSPC